MLKELRLNHNRLSGEIPSCLLQLRDLEFLTLNDNKALWRFAGHYSIAADSAGSSQKWPHGCAS